jgi:hypothetical protein
MAVRKKQVYFGIMIVSGLALAVDRFVLSESVTAPDEVKASPQETPASLAGSTGAAAEEEVPAIPELPFPRDVERFEFGSDIPDLFAPPRHFVRDATIPSVTGADDPGSENIPPPRGLNSGAFTIQHELDGVLDHQRLKIAIIDGRWMRIGDEVDGCTLARISGDGARFECRDGEAVLGPPRPGGGARD